MYVIANSLPSITSTFENVTVLFPLGSISNLFLKINVKFLLLLDAFKTVPGSSLTES